VPFEALFINHGIPSTYKVEYSSASLNHEGVRGKDGCFRNMSHPASGHFPCRRFLFIPTVGGDGSLCASCRLLTPYKSIFPSTCTHPTDLKGQRRGGHWAVARLGNGFRDECRERGRISPARSVLESYLCYFNALGNACYLS
jgi:hypothetical protein